MRMIRLSDFSPEQIRLMVKLDDGLPHEDSVGTPRSDLTEEQDANLLALIMEGLVDVDEGYGGIEWVRLTERGRKVREQGWA